MGSHHDHLAIQFYGAIHDGRAWGTFANDSFGIRHKCLQLAHGFVSLFTQEMKRINATHYTAHFGHAKDVDDMQKDELCFECSGKTPAPSPKHSEPERRSLWLRGSLKSLAYPQKFDLRSSCSPPECRLDIYSRELDMAATLVTPSRVQNKIYQLRRAEQRYVTRIIVQKLPEAH
jgi:hypothetical protein